MTLVRGVVWFVCFHGRPRQATGVLQPAGLLYRPLWTFQIWPPDAPAPTDAFRTLAAEVGTYGDGGYVELLLFVMAFVRGIYLQQTIFLGYIVLQLFCSYSLRHM
jgi:hypothetical protein